LLSNSVQISPTFLCHHTTPMRSNFHDAHLLQLLQTVSDDSSRALDEMAWPDPTAVIPPENLAETTNPGGGVDVHATCNSSASRVVPIWVCWGLLLETAEFDDVNVLWKFDLTSLLQVCSISCNELMGLNILNHGWLFFFLNDRIHNGDREGWEVQGCDRGGLRRVRVRQSSMCLSTAWAARRRPQPKGHGTFPRAAPHNVAWRAIWPVGSRIPHPQKSPCPEAEEVDAAAAERAEAAVWYSGASAWVGHSSRCLSMADTLNSAPHPKGQATVGESGLGGL